MMKMQKYSKLVKNGFTSYSDTGLKITGNEDNVISFNEVAIETIDALLPGLSLIVSSLKHYRGSRFSTSSPSSTSGGSTGGSSGGGGGGY